MTDTFPTPLLRRRASRTLALGGTLALAAAMTGCGPDPDYRQTSEDYAQVCRDETTQERVPDEDCDDSAGTSHAHAGHRTGWYFIPLAGGRTVPAVGQRAGGGLTTRPGTGTTTKVPSSGGEFAKSGTVSKGGFGSKGGGAGS